MTDAPERIWADPPEIFDGMDLWREWPTERATEYTRSDLIPAMIAEAVAREREALEVACQIDIDKGDKNGATQYAAAARAALKVTP